MPVAAEEENILQNISGTSCDGKPVIFSNGFQNILTISIRFDVLKSLTAKIRPISDGKISTAVSSPSFAPSVKAEKTSVFLYTPNSIIVKTIAGIIKEFK